MTLLSVVMLHNLPSRLVGINQTLHKYMLKLGVEPNLSLIE